VSFVPHIGEKFPRMSYIPLLPGAVGCDNFEIYCALLSRCVMLHARAPSIFDSHDRFLVGCAVHRSHHGPSPLACPGPEQ
jgi:hypothetical protein